ncbi:hypothetical protein [Rhodoligotrophos appendicifer]|uniref:hypothetical protein n=1 Tax=Rhodoligotrophos appendicifer TaxID=987056 RepID=UPI001FE7A3E2|nr:hypothetical protein [Rhodoligotrophos appendicifer]
MTELRYGNKAFPLPQSKLARIAIGGGLVAGGVLGFLPILGFWMIPLGLVVLSFDLPMVRRGRRRLTVRLGRRFKKRWPSAWHRHVTEAKPHVRTHRTNT